MFKRPLFWGILVSIIGVIAWVISIVFNVLTLGKFREVSNLFGIIALGALPIALIAEGVQWMKKRNNQR